MRFSSEAAYEAHENGEPIMVTRAWAERTIAQHNPGDDVAEFWSAQLAAATIDAWTVLEWLGY